MHAIMADTVTSKLIDKIRKAETPTDKAELFLKTKYLNRAIWIVEFNDGEKFVRYLTNAEKLGLIYPDLKAVSSIFAVDFYRQ